MSDRSFTPEERLACYILENYGECAVEPCRCNITGALGNRIECPDWRTCGATNYEELRTWQARPQSSNQ